MSNPSRKNSPQQATEPTFSGNNSADWALWRLSLVLKEISETLATAKSEESTLWVLDTGSKSAFRRQRNLTPTPPETETEQLVKESKLAINNAPLIQER